MEQQIQQRPIQQMNPSQQKIVAGETQPAKKSRLWLWLIIVLVIIGVCAGIYFLFFRGIIKI